MSDELHEIIIGLTPEELGKLVAYLGLLVCEGPQEL